MRLLLFCSTLLLPFIVACKDDSPTQGNDPCSGGVPVSAATGFRLDGSGYANAEVDLDSTVSKAGGAGTSFTNVGVGSGVGTVIVRGTDAVVREGDTATVILAIRFPGIKTGVYAWSDATSGADSNGVSISIVRDGVAESFMGVSGSTVVDHFAVNASETNIGGSFCGTLKDSTGRTVTVSGGRFTTRE